MPKQKTVKNPAQRKNLYLALTVAFFLAIIAIFIFDGYMGVYDTVRITTQEQEELIQPEYWSRDYPQSTWTNEGQDIYFRYELDNRTFSTYSADIEVAVWFGETKLEVLLTQAVNINGFDKEELSWTVDTGTLRPADIPQNQDYEFSVIITRDGVERRIIVHISTPPIKYG
jgi:hypothetical protein